MVKIIKITGVLLLAALFSLLQTGCKPRDYAKLPAYSHRNFLQAVIEVPAGTNLQVSYCQLSKRFRVNWDGDDGEMIDYLPYPFNYGFIPSSNSGGIEGEEKMLDVMVICESLEIGTVIEIIPLGLLVLKDDFRTEYKVLAIPADVEKQVVRGNIFEDIITNYPALTDIIEDWYVNAKLYTNPLVLGWEDEHVTQAYISKWLVGI